MVIRDVLYGDINIEDDIIEKLLRTKEMQRLRGIKQLGLTYLIFPGAEHSRYTHSIGVYYLATRLVAVLEKKVGFKFVEDEKKALFIACLLHDLGHGPYSHASEHYFAYDHEALTIDIINDSSTQINKTVKDLRYYEDILKFIEKKHENKVLNSILSSSIDADRMDYLVRDSYYCGVSYGNFDMSRILKIIDVVDEQVVFLEKGIHTIEDFILSRYHMFTQVYLNEKSSGYEMLIGEILRRIAELKDADYSFTANLMALESFYDKKEISVCDFIEMDDMRLFHILAELRKLESDEKLIALCTTFLDHHRLVINEPEACEYIWSTQNYSKKVYDEREPILIKMEDGSIKRLEEVSKIIDLFKREVKIEAQGVTFGIGKDE